jgi:hypothetical protein
MEFIESTYYRKKHLQSKKFIFDEVFQIKVYRSMLSRLNSISASPVDVTLGINHVSDCPWIKNASGLKNAS